MAKPLISICIPTYNRANFLKECLDSITVQFLDKEVRDNINIFILDNQSQDNTEEVVKEFTDIFENIKYIKDDQNRNIVQGIIKVASFANGEYMWVFSDDDLHVNNSLKIVINCIKKYSSDLIFSNLSMFNNDSVINSNLLEVNSDTIINNRKELFSFLNHKFCNSIDYYTTLCSNWILKKEIFDKNNYIFEEFNGSLDLFPLPSLVFYTNIEFKSYILSKQIILYRGGNESWGKKNKIKHFLYRDKIWRDYYWKIIINNKKKIPKYFILKVYLKNLLRIIDLLKIVVIELLVRFGLYNVVKRIVSRKHN